MTDRINPSCNTKHLLKMPEGFVQANTLINKEWNGAAIPNATNIWTDGTNTYCSFLNDHYVLEKGTRNWKRKAFFGLNSDTSFSTNYVWTDGVNTYYSESTNHFVLNKETDTWVPKTWHGIDDLTSFRGECVWTDGFNIFYSGTNYDWNTNFYTAINYILDLETDTWSTINLGYAINGYEVWSDGTDIYTPAVSNRYVLLSYNSFSKKFTSGFDLDFSMRGDFVWSDGTNVYYSNSGDQYILNKETNTWDTMHWEDSTFLEYGSRVWSDGDRTYALVYKDNYNDSCVFNKETGTWDSVVWNGFFNLDTDYIWSDGENIYYGDYYVLNKETSTWELKTWNGLSSFDPDAIWTDGENIYYSGWDNQCVLDKATNTWSAKAWSGLTDFYGTFIWTDGENIYYSLEAEQFVLNKETSTWEPKTWNELASFNGSNYNIWSDGENIYYDDSYILNKETSTWEPKTWNGPVSPHASWMWSDGVNTYSSNGDYQYVLNGDTLEITNWRSILQGRDMLKFEEITFHGGDVWTDGENIYVGGLFKLLNSAESKIVCLTEEGWIDMRGSAVEDAEIIVPLQDEIVFTPSAFSQESNPSYYYKKVVVNPVKTQSLTVKASVKEQTFWYSNDCFFDNVTVEAADLSTIEGYLGGIYLEEFPKTVYNIGERLDSDGGTIKLCYTNGTTFRVNLVNSDIWGWPDATNKPSPGPHTLTVKYTERGVTAQTTYQITLNTPDNAFIFAIAGKKLFATNGTTWAEWVDSSYNAAGVTVSDNKLCDTRGYVLCNSNNVAVTLTELISVGAEYTWLRGD